MLIRPYGNRRFLLDVGPGDIFEHGGDALLVGRPEGAVGPAGLGERFADRANWVPAVRGAGRAVPGLRTPALRWPGAVGGWGEAFAVPHRPKGKVRVPRFPDDAADRGGWGFSRLWWELEFALFTLWSRHRGAGGWGTDRPVNDVSLGLVPLSCRRPDAVALATMWAVSELFWGQRDRRAWPGRLTVTVRTLGDPAPLAAAFDRGRARRFLTESCGLRGGRADPWRAAK